MLRSFPPVTDNATRLLILGSLPGAISLREQRYYANPRNAFWPLVGHVIAVDLTGLAYPDRLSTLLRHGIGLWDVVDQAERIGSLDSAIRNAQAHDLCALTATLPALTTIAFNGGTAAKIGMAQLGGERTRYRLVKLLSSSGACAIRADVKRADWLRLADWLT